MDTKLFEDMEKFENDYEKSHPDRLKYINERLDLYISNYHLKEGDPISKYPETREKIEQDKNEILNYINELYETNQKAFELIKILGK